MEHRQIDFVIQFGFENWIIKSFCLCSTTDGTFLRILYPSRRRKPLGLVLNSNPWFWWMRLCPETFQCPTHANSEHLRSMQTEGTLKSWSSTKLVRSCKSESVPIPPPPQLAHFAPGTRSTYNFNGKFPTQPHPFEKNSRHHSASNGPSPAAQSEPEMAIRNQMNFRAEFCWASCYISDFPPPFSHMS